MSFTIEKREDIYVGKFEAMASPCEILIENEDIFIANNITSIAYQEAKRIESKYSRYTKDSVVSRINKNTQTDIEVDEETCMMLNFANEAYELSDGLFDVTSGVMRKVWKFDGSDNIPSKEQVNQILPFVGWSKIFWKKPVINLPNGMEIDFGGLGKEYAVDKAMQIISEKYNFPILINFGGDLRANKSPSARKSWAIEIKNISNYQKKSVFYLESGAVATSGDENKFLIKNGIRYCHIINPKTGYPLLEAPHSVTVGSRTCIEAGLLSTLAILHGKLSGKFLEAQGVKHYIQY